MHSQTVIRQQIFHAHELDGQLLEKQMQKMRNPTFLCEGHQQLRMLELCNDQPLPGPEIPCPAAVEWFTGKPWLAPEGVSCFEGHKGWQASWSLQGDPLIVIASYTAPSSNLEHLRELEARFYQRVREKETRGSMHYRWHWSFGEEKITIKATEVYRDLAGFEEHLAACDDLFQEVEAYRSLLGVDLYGSEELMQKCEVYAGRYAPVRRFRTRCTAALGS